MAHSTVRSRRPLLTPDDAEELADISLHWPRSVVAREAVPRAVEEDLEFSPQLVFSKRAPEVVRNYSIASDGMSSPVSDGTKPEIHSRRVRRSIADAIKLETLRTGCDELDSPNRIETMNQSPSSRILHPVQSLLFEKISGASPTGSLSPSPTSEETPSPTAEECEKNTDETDPLPASSLSSGATELEQEQESEARAPAATEPERHFVEDSISHASEQSLLDSDSIPAAAPTPPSVVMIVYDAEKKPLASGLDYAINTTVKEGDEIILLGYLQHVMSPMGHKMVADTSQFTGVNEKCLRMEATGKKQAAEKMISNTGRQRACEQKKVKLSVRIAPGALPRSVIVQQAKALNATRVIFDRNAMKEKKSYFIEHLSCDVLKMTKDGRSTETIRSGELQESCQTPENSIAAPAFGQSVSMTHSDTSSHESRKSLQRSVTTITSNGSDSMSSSSGSSIWSKFKSFRASRRSGSSIAVNQQSAIGSSMSSTQSSSPSHTFISTSTPEDTQYSDESDILHGTNFVFAEAQSF